MNNFLKSAQEIKKEIEEFKEFINGNETVEKPGFKKDLEALFNTNKKVNEDLQVRWEHLIKHCLLKLTA
ncbi:MAG: hypothetical protein IPI78_04670 [Chitinophagaceae bacterium]|nr:hypothetical protein [Chitinophagaceae bacterium]